EPPHEFLELGHLLHELRLFKSAGELKLMQRAADIAREALLAAMRATHDGAREFEVEAALQYVYRRNNSCAAYEPIVGAGANACVLHYRANNAPMADGELLLVDAGAEYAGYASDITRTWPVSGRYSPAQRALYQLVLDAQGAALAQARPGRSWIAGHEAAVSVLTEGLLSLGLLKGTLKKNLASGEYKRFYMHKTGHWIGLDVHDVGEYKVAGEFRELEPGMVFTIEPGLYIAPGSKGVPAKYQGIGIRIEDDVLVTKHGHRNLTDGVPREIDAIESVLATR
ncbi:MAG: M24B family metallopeptidase, partial [Arenimonas sp.]